MILQIDENVRVVVAHTASQICYFTARGGVYAYAIDTVETPHVFRAYPNHNTETAMREILAGRALLLPVVNPETSAPWSAPEIVELWTAFSTKMENRNNERWNAIRNQFSERSREYLAGTPRFQQARQSSESRYREFLNYTETQRTMDGVRTWRGETTRR